MSILNKINYNLYRAKYRYGKELSSYGLIKTPVDVSLELSSECNMACEYCYHSDQDKLPFKKGIMSLNTGMKIIKQSSEIGVNSLKFNWKGESTINPHFKELTEYAKNLSHGNVFIDRLTNSNFKFRNDRDDIFDGLCNQTKVKVSYDSFMKDVFETQRAKGDHDLTTKNIDKFYNYPKRKDTEIVIQAVRTKLNKNEDIESLCKSRWPSATISIRDMVGGRVDKDLDKLEDKKRDLSNRQSCIQAHVRIIFNWEGKAFPCCPDIEEKLCLGDINKESIYEIFNNQKSKILKNKLLDKTAFNQFSSCMNCSSFESYANYKPSWVS